MTQTANSFAWDIYTTARLPRNALTECRIVTAYIALRLNISATLLAEILLLMILFVYWPNVFILIVLSFYPLSEFLLLLQVVMMMMMIIIYWPGQCFLFPDLWPDVSDPLSWGKPEHLPNPDGNGCAASVLEPDTGPLGLHPPSSGCVEEDIPHREAPGGL